jgi:hypothetical protein
MSIIKKMRTKNNFKNIYIFSVLLYVLYSAVYDIETSFIKILTIGLSFLFLLLIYKAFRKNKMSIIASLIGLLCVSIPISFRSVFGNSVREIPLPWFYIILGLLLLYTIFIKKRVKYTLVNLIILTLAFLLLVPLLLSFSFIEGLKEYLSYITFICGVFIASAFSRKINENEYLTIIQVYVFSVLCSALGFIYQYLMYNFANTTLFGVSYYGGGRVLYRFLFGDISGATLYLATGAMLLTLTKRKYKIIYIFIVLIGMVSTSSRTGFLVFLVTLFLFFIRTNSFKKKLSLLILFLTVSAVGFYIMSHTRTNIDNIYSVITDGTGRVEGLYLSIEKFLESPLIGNGLDLGVYLKTTGKGGVAHFALINLLAQTGIFISFLFLTVLFIIYKNSRIIRREELRWVIIMSLIGSSIIPGFFNMRFFTVISILAITTVEKKTSVINYPYI